MDTTKISLFKGKQIRKTLYQNEWWFVVEDVVLALIDSHDPKQYIQRMKQRDPELAKGWVQIVHTLEIPTEGGNQKMLCASTESVFRIVQSVPSPKAEPLKRWLARVRYERVQEIENPEFVNHNLSFSISLSFPLPICHSRESGNPVEGKLKWESNLIYA